MTESLVDWADLYGRNRCWGTAFWVDPFDSSAPRRLGNELFLDTWMQIPLLCLVAEYRGRARLENVVRRLVKPTSRSLFAGYQSTLCR